MTPLQKAVQAVIEDHCDKSPYFDDAMAGLRKALEAEQEKAVEPHGWMIDGSSEVMSRGHAQAVQTEHQAMGGTAVAYPIYTHPAPPASDHVPETAFGNTERAELIARLRSTAYQDDEIKAHAREAADMLEADAASQARERHTRATLNKVLVGLNEAQQVAVPVTKTRVGNYLRRHESGDNTMFRNGFKDGVKFAEARHGIGAKPSHTDWSAA